MKKHAILPDIKELIARYWQERQHWLSVGKPIRSKERVKEIYDICKGCVHFEKHHTMERGKCKLCGCRLAPGGNTALNKIAWAVTECPDIPPKWTAEDKEQWESYKVNNSDIPLLDRKCCGEK